MSVEEVSEPTIQQSTDAIVRMTPTPIDGARRHGITVLDEGAVDDASVRRASPLGSD